MSFHLVNTSRFLVSFLHFTFILIVGILYSSQAMGTYLSEVQCDDNLDIKAVPLFLPEVAPYSYQFIVGGGPFYYADSYNMVTSIEQDILSLYGDTGIIAPCGHDAFLPSSRSFSWWPGCNSGSSLIARIYRIQSEPVPDGYTRVLNDDDNVPVDVQCSQTCKAPYGIKDSSGECITFCPPGSSGPSPDTGECLLPANQAEPSKMCAGNPIDISSGEKVQYETPDYQSQGTLPLIFERNYQSNRAPESDYWLDAGQIQAISASKAGWVRYVQPDGYQGVDIIVPLTWDEIPDSDGALQPPVAGQKQWMHNYQISLKNTTDELIRSTSEGEERFSDMGDGVYSSLQVSPLQVIATTLSDGSAGFVYQKEPQLSEYFNSNGQLIRIEQSSHIYQSLSYNEQGQLIQVTHSLGGELQLSYNEAAQLSQLTTPDNTTIHYLYDSYGNLSQVTKTFSDGQSSS